MSEYEVKSTDVSNEQGESNMEKQHRKHDVQPRALQDIGGGQESKPSKTHQLLCWGGAFAQAAVGGPPALQELLIAEYKQRHRKPTGESRPP